jgi:hypothetical protein
MIFRFRYLLVFGLVFGYFYQYHLVQIVSLFFYSVFILIEDFKGGVLRRLDISTSFAFLLMLTSISHFGALSLWFDTGLTWANYLKKDFLADGLFVFSIGSLVTMEAMRRAIAYSSEYQIDYRKRSFFVTVFVASVLLFVARHFRLLPSLGTITSFIELLINGSVFLLSYMAHKENGRTRILSVVIYVISLSFYAIQFSYLRMEIIIPWLAYFMGEIIARKRLLDLHLISKVIFTAGLLIFPVIFTYLGKNRERLRGSGEKLQLVLKQGTKFIDEGEGETLLSRMNVLGQMSNVVDLTNRKGFYEGYTLRYYSFVFIPRFIWPDKPILDGGQWFAVEIGRSYYLPNGRAANSVNMTIPGEMFLNFGWIGLITGCFLFGYFIAFIWNSVRSNDLFSWAFRFYLLFLGMFSLGSDLMIIPQLVAYWLIYKFILFVRRNVYA